MPVKASAQSSFIERAGEESMFSHIMVGSNNIEQSKRFYDAVFAAIGAKPGFQDEKGVNYRHNGAMLMVRPPLNGEAASHGNGSTIGFNLDSPERVSAWHDAGVAAGGTSIENPPGGDCHSQAGQNAHVGRDDESNDQSGHAKQRRNGE